MKVVDFTQFEAGPSCTEALGWLGADVVKIENPKMGDPGRRLRPGQPDNDPYYFHVFNANKKSITVNLKSPKGLDLVNRANPDHWDRLLKLIDRQDLIGDKRYLTPADRVEREAEVDEVISAWTRKHTKLDAMKLVGEAGIPAGAVLDTDELNKDVTFGQRGIMQTMIHPVHRPFKMPAWPVRVDGKATRIKSSPMLGEHTDQVLSDWLGLNAPAVAELKSEGVV